MQIGIARTATTGVTIVSIGGELDISSAPTLQRVLAGVRETDDHLVVDLTALEFSDSTGIVTLVDLARHRDGDVVLALRADGEVRRLFDLSGVSNLVRCFETVDDAVAAAEVRR